MNLVDSSAWVEYFMDAPNAAFFAPAIEDLGQLLVPTVCLFEVTKSILRTVGNREAAEKGAVMRRGKVIDLTVPLALQAVPLGIEHKLAAIDSIILATARAFHATLWTQDSDFEGLLGVKYRLKKGTRS